MGGTDDHAGWITDFLEYQLTDYFSKCIVLYWIEIACLTPAFITGAAQTAPQDMQTRVCGIWCTATQALSFVLGPLISTGLYQLNPVFPYYFLNVLLTGLGLIWAVNH
jgi:hypothetical protein